jgi:hypothetical protein
VPKQISFLHSATRRRGSTNEKSEYLCDKEELPSDSIVYLTSKRPTWLAGRFINTNWDMPELLAKEKEIVEGDLLKFKCLGLF